MKGSPQEHDYSGVDQNNPGEDFVLSPVLDFPERRQRITRVLIFALLRSGEEISDKGLLAHGIRPEDPQVALAKIEGLSAKLSNLKNSDRPGIDDVVLLSPPLAPDSGTMEISSETETYFRITAILNNFFGVPASEIERFYKYYAQYSNEPSDGLLKKIALKMDLESIPGLLSPFTLDLVPGDWIKDPQYNLEYLIEFSKLLNLIARELSGKMEGEKLIGLIQEAYNKNNIDRILEEVRNINLGGKKRN